MIDRLNGGYLSFDLYIWHHRKHMRCISRDTLFAFPLYMVLLPATVSSLHIQNNSESHFRKSVHEQTTYCSSV